MTPDWAHAEELDALAEERDEARRELDLLRSAAREHLQAVVEHDCHVAFGEYETKEAHNAGVDRVKAAESKLIALLGVEDTTERIEERFEVGTAPAGDTP